jgi:hypothetical protein
VSTFVIMDRQRILLLCLLIFVPVLQATEPHPAVDQAVPYELVSQQTINAHGETYEQFCVASQAASKAQRAHTMVKAVLAAKQEHPDVNMILMLAPDKALCHLGRLTGMLYHVPSGTGWAGVYPGSWHWHILTTGRAVTEQQIVDTVLYERHVAEFKARFGELDYHPELDAFVRDQLGREPDYVTTGLWVDVYHTE